MNFDEYMKDVAGKSSFSFREGRIYIKDPSQAPAGARVQRGKRGGYYYEDQPKQKSDKHDDLFKNPGVVDLKQIVSKEEATMIGHASWMYLHEYGRYDMGDIMNIYLHSLIGGKLMRGEKSVKTGTRKYYEHEFKDISYNWIEKGDMIIDLTGTKSENPKIKVIKKGSEDSWIYQYGDEVEDLKKDIFDRSGRLQSEQYSAAEKWLSIIDPKQTVKGIGLVSPDAERRGIRALERIGVDFDVKVTPTKQFPQGLPLVHISQAQADKFVHPKVGGVEWDIESSAAMFEPDSLRRLFLAFERANMKGDVGAYTDGRHPFKVYAPQEYQKSFTAAISRAAALVPDGHHRLSRVKEISFAPGMQADFTTPSGRRFKVRTAAGVCGGSDIAVFTKYRPEKSEREIDDMIQDTTIHEMAHGIEGSISKGRKKEWKDVRQSRTEKPPSHYAREGGMSEDFAVTYAKFARGELDKREHPKRFAFMKKLWEELK